MSRSLILSFEGPSDVVRPGRCDVRPLLEVFLRFVELLEKIGAHDAVDSDEAPFVVAMTELRAGSIKNVLDFVPRHRGEGGAAAAKRAGLDAARLAAKYLERRDTGPLSVRTSSRKLATALVRLPEDITAHLRGSVDASLSEMAAAAPEETTVSIESFRAKILRAGGVSPRVQLQVHGLERPITLEAPEQLAKLAGQTLYADADVTAKIERAGGAGAPPLFRVVRAVEHVAFTYQAAEKITKWASPATQKRLAQETTNARRVVKYDALIVGTAQLHHADVLVSLDDDVKALGKLAGIRVAEPKELLRGTQGNLFSS